MPGHPWWDIFKIYSLAFSPDPISAKTDEKNLSSAGISNPNAQKMWDIRGGEGGTGGGGNLVQLGASSNEMVDMTSCQDRQARYKEYERLRNIAEIENCMTVYADEACVAGSTKISTPFGFPTIEWLAEHKANDRFLVYCYDFEKEDYTLGWAFNPRKTGTKKTVKVVLDDGSHFICTPDHRVLLRNGNWIEAGDLKFQTELMPFYKINPLSEFNKLKTNQFPRIFTFHDGWTHERLFVDKWRTGKPAPYQEKVQKAIRLLSGGLNVRQTSKMMGHEWRSIYAWLKNHGFTTKEVQRLGQFEDRRRVVGVMPYDEIDVYDISVEDHKCFATDSVILHNCQEDDEGHICKVIVDDQDVKAEAELALYKIIDIDQKAWNWFKNDIISGDGFYELVIDVENPKDGIARVERLPQETMYRIETVKGRVVEFQQSNDGPDYQILTKIDVTTATEEDLKQTNLIARFSPNQIVHIRHGEDRKTFYPYGQSLIEPARGPAHQLRMMEDAMLVYRLTRAPERRVFYIDVGQIAGARAEAFMKQIQDQFKKRKTTGRSHGSGANSVEERWHAPAQDEDYWIPMRPNSNTRVETLPGAQNLGEIDDALYFRNKLYIALNFPKNYFNTEDTNQTRITLSAQDVRFARNIERLQRVFARGIREMVVRHLYLCGFPEENYSDLKIEMTPPSAWRELSLAEVKANRMNEATTYKSSQILPDFDIYTRILHYTEDEARDIQARMKVQKMDDLKLQIIANNPALLGVGMPGDGGQELGTEAGGPSPELAPPEPNAGGEGPPVSQAMLPGNNSSGLSAGMLKYMPADVNTNNANNTNANDQESPPPLPDVSEEDIKKYNMDIEDYASEQDAEDIDYSEF